MKANKAYTIAVDLGGTKILVGIINAESAILGKRSCATKIEEGFEQAIDSICRLSFELLKELSISVQECILSVCAPGPIDLSSGSLVESVNLGWGIVPLRSLLEQRLSIPVFLEHDAKASALGEFHYGRGKGESSMVYLVAGTGVGGAIIIDGKLYRGMHNYAGELGHFTIDYDGKPGLTDIRGNVQSFLAGPSLALRYRELMEEAGKSLSDVEIDGKYVGDRAMEGDVIAMRVLTQAGQALGIAVASLAMILDIELYVVGSSVAQLGGIILNPARETLPQYSFKAVADLVRIESSMLKNNAALLGCDYIARNGQDF